MMKVFASIDSLFLITTDQYSKIRTYHSFLFSSIEI